MREEMDLPTFSFIYNSHYAGSHSAYLIRSYWIALQPSRSDEHGWKPSISQCRANLSKTLPSKSISPPLHPISPSPIHKQEKFFCFCEPRATIPIASPSSISPGNSPKLLPFKPLARGTLHSLPARSTHRSRFDSHVRRSSGSPTATWVAVPNETPKSNFRLPHMRESFPTHTVHPLPIENIYLRTNSPSAKGGTNRRRGMGRRSGKNIKRGQKQRKSRRPIFQDMANRVHLATDVGSSSHSHSCFF
ncbi:hypothetical protein F4818DRAFT_242497 [Hypoxylon cercidicola]|nr:hypothetical protein F4818DRAFT_242497 [Hypoxylon cercidicola]